MYSCYLVNTLGKREKIYLGRKICKNRERQRGTEKEGMVKSEKKKNREGAHLYPLKDEKEHRNVMWLHNLVGGSTGQGQVAPFSLKEKI